MPKPSLTVIIPAVNEESIIKKIVQDSLKHKQYKITVLVVIDSKTTDRTKPEAIKAGAKVIHAGSNKGKGAAFRYVIPYLKSDYAIQIDADYQFLPSEIPKLIEPLRKNYDVTLGTRYQKGAYVEKESVSVLKYFGSLFLSLATSLFARQRISDVMAGFKAFKTPALKKIAPTTNHFGYEAELVIKAAQNNYRIKNVPISYKKRTSGRSSVDSIKHGALVLETILRIGFRI